MAAHLTITTIVLLGVISSFALLHVQGAPITNETETIAPPLQSETESSQDVPTTSSSSPSPPQRRRPGQVTSRNEEGLEEQSGQQLSDVAEETLRDAQRAGTAAYLAYNYILTNYLGGEEPSPASPCFSDERGEHELDGHIHPNVDYLERLVQDYSSLTSYHGYLERVEEEYNSTLQKEPVCGYCVRFYDIMSLTVELKTSLESLIRSVNSATADSLSHNVSEEAETGSGETGEDDHCQVLCFDQQARVFLRYQAFAAIYVVNDVNGLLEQKLDSKKE